MSDFLTDHLMVIPVTMPPPIDRAALVAADVTLDGRPARISGTRNDFATVRTVDGASSCEWAWPTAARIVNLSGGRFES